MHKLTPRQLQVIKLLSKGLTRPEIAYQLDIKLNTVNNTLQMAYRVLRVNNKEDAINKLREIN